VLAQIRAELRLDRPLPEQYLVWLGNVLTGDFGFSWRIRQPVSALILEKLPVTAQLATMAFLIAVAIGVPAGILSAVRRDRPADWVANAVALFGISVPNFWLGIMMILLFSVELGWLPASGYVPFFENPVANITAMILPVFATGLRESAELTRMLRSSLLEELGSDYVRTALSKGLSRRVVVMRHAVRNALVPFVTASGLQIAGLLGGLVVTETVFQLPGLGRLVVDSIEQRDFTTVQGSVLVITLIVVLVNVLVDTLYAFIDPRISAGSGG
jgi:peptide/nickel transport system permease protein